MNPTCPKCSRELEEYKDRYICTGSDCSLNIAKDDYEKVKQEYDQARLSWNERLCRDDSLWYKTAFVEYPSIIAHEYWRLYDLLENGQTYGALLQLKDLFEVLIKFSTLILASVIYNKETDGQGINTREKNILINLMKKPLSLGDWLEQARILVENSGNEVRIEPVLKDLIKIFNSHNLINWRNEELGHGALSFDSSDKFQEDMKNRISLIKEHLIRFDLVYCSMELHLAGEEKFTLQGKDRIYNLPYDEGELNLSIGEFKQIISPYIILRDKGIYFYDSYYIRKERTSILNYPQGEKHKIHDQSLVDLFSRLSRDAEMEELTGSIEDSTRMTREDAILSEIAAVDDFQRPRYLEKWLQENVSQNEKGVFLLQMERGTGKTTFVRALDHLAEGRIEIAEDLSIRAYYIDGFYLYRMENFISKISDQLREDKNRENNRITGDLPILRADSSEKALDMARMINTYRAMHQKHFGKRRLLFILDGLDEIPVTKGQSIFDFLPAPEMLEEGVYLLLTCRPQSELSYFTKSHLERLKLTEQISFGKDDPENLGLLKVYIKERIKPDPEEVEEILAKAENRFLYVNTISELRRARNAEELKDLPQGEELFPYYMERLRSSYGEKFFQGLLKCLLILASAYEPLTLQELSGLLGEERPTFKLLANILDIKGFLKIERSYRGNLLSLAHPEVKSYILQAYLPLLQKIIKEWVNEILGLGKTRLDPSNDSETYLFAYLLRYSKDFAGDEEVRLVNIEYAYALYALAFNIDKLNTKRHSILRAIQAYTVCIEVLEVLLGAGNLLNENDLAQTYMNRGVAYYRTQKIKEALKDFDRAIEIRGRLLGAGYLLGENDLTDAFINRGNAYLSTQKIKEAMEDYNRAIALLEILLRAGKLLDENNLARAYMNRGIAYRDIQKIKEAQEDYNRAIEIKERLLGASKLLDENDLAGAYMSRGVAYVDTKKIKEALEDYDRAIEIKERLLGLGKLLDENDLAGAYMNRGVAYGRNQKMKEALGDYDRTIEIRESLLGAGRLLDENDLAQACLNRGNAYWSTQKIKEALKDYNRAIEIRESLLGAGRLLGEDDLAQAYKNRGNAYCSTKKIKEALKDYGRAIEIGERLLGAGKLLYEDGLAQAYMNRGIAYWSTQKIKEALKDYDRAIEIGERLLGAGKLLYEEDLSRAYMNRGIAYRDIQKIKEALEDYDRAIEIGERLLGAGQLLDENDLARAYMNRGVAYYSNQKIKEALKDFDRAIEIRGRLLGAGQLLDEDDLAGAYMIRGGAYVRTQKNKEALEDFDRALEIRERLLGAGQLLDEDDLAGAYMMRGIAYCDIQKIKEALEDYDHAIEIWERLQGAGQLLQENVLAYAYMYRGNAYKNTQKIKETLEDYDRAIEIWERLQGAGQLLDENDLADAYMIRGIVLEESGRNAEAEQNFKRANALQEHLNNDNQLNNETPEVL